MATNTLHGATADSTPSRRAQRQLAQHDNATATPGKNSKEPFKVRFQRDKQMILMLVPGVAFLLLFFYVPILGNVIAFQDYQPYLGISASDFVGFQNFVDLSRIRTSGTRYATPWCWRSGSWCCSSRCH